MLHTPDQAFELRPHQVAAFSTAEDDLIRVRLLYAEALKRITELEDEIERLKAADRRA